MSAFVTPHHLFFSLLSAAFRAHHSRHRHRGARFPAWVLPFAHRLLCCQGLPGLLLRWHPGFWRLIRRKWRSPRRHLPAVYFKLLNICSKRGRTFSAVPPPRPVFVPRCTVQDFLLIVFYSSLCCLFASLCGVIFHTQTFKKLWGFYIFNGIAKGCYSDRNEGATPDAYLLMQYETLGNKAHTPLMYYCFKRPGWLRIFAHLQDPLKYILSI